LPDVLGPSSITKQRPLSHDPAGFLWAHLDRDSKEKSDIAPATAGPRGREKALTLFSLPV